MEDKEFKKYYRKHLAFKNKKSLNEGVTWENRKFGERLPTMKDYLEEGPVEDFEDAEFAAHSATLENPGGVEGIRTDILSTIDELNQFLNGNVTKESLIETLNDLALTLEEL